MTTAAVARPTAILSVEGVVKTYRHGNLTVRAADELSFSIPEGVRCIALIGPDGAGKSTLMKMLCGLEVPDEGRIEVLGTTPDPEDESFVGRVSFMPQSLGLYKDLSCEENLRTFALLRGRPAGETPEALAAHLRGLLKTAGLEGFESRPAGKLSGGMKQKLALATALVKTPRLLVLDEPTVGVDPLSRRELWAMIEGMLEKTDMTCLFSTAYLEEAEAADLVLMLEAGRLLVLERPADLLARAEGRVFRTLETMSALGERARRLLGSVTGETSPLLDAVPREGAMAFVMRRPMSAQDLSRALGLAVEVRRPRLEDAYAAVTVRPDGKVGTTLSAIPARPSPSDAEVVVRADGINRKVGNFTAVADTTFAIRRGEIFGLLGPNGAGKTTTFRMLCGLLAPSGGEVEVAGYDLRTAKADARKRLGYVAQRFSLYGKLTVTENLRYFGKSYGLHGALLKERVEGAIVGFGLEAQRDVTAATLSEGAKRDLSMSCALLHRPDILFLDEATSGADLASRRALWRRIVALSDLGTTVVVTTHFLEEAEYCDRFLIQDAGRVLVLGTPDEVRHRAAGGARSIEDAFLAIVRAFRAQPKEATS